MDEAAQSRLDAALQSANPSGLSRLKTAEFIKAIGKLYTELDYIHPFGDGNSRTLREFTRELALSHIRHDDTKRIVVLSMDQRSEEHTSALQSLMRTSYAVFCLQQNNEKQL